MRLAIISWGNNSEREISLISAQAVKKWLEELWYTSILLYDFPSHTTWFIQDHQKDPVDFIFLMVHGAWGEDGQIASFLDLLHIPYQCSSADVLALTINKWHTKLVRRAYGLPVADDIVLIPNQYTREDIVEQINTTLWFPCVRKELDQWSSKWVHILNCNKDLSHIWTEYVTYQKPILIEKFLEGEEITIPILDGKDGEYIVLPLIHIIPPKEGGFDYENKYNGMTQEICPSGFSSEICLHIEEIARQAYQAVWCTKYGRIDAILTEKWPILLEINTIPWFTNQSLFPKSAQVYGYTFPELLAHLIQISLKE